VRQDHKGLDTKECLVPQVLQVLQVHLLGLEHTDLQAQPGTVPQELLALQAQRGVLVLVLKLIIQRLQDKQLLFVLPDTQEQLVVFNAKKVLMLLLGVFQVCQLRLIRKVIIWLMGGLALAVRIVQQL